jgi:ornithine carbamoyltransferase
MKRDFISLHDFTSDEIRKLLDLASAVKARPENYRRALEGKTLAMIFEKASTRTRVSFETGMYQLGGLGLFLSSRDLQLGRGEPIADTARVLSRYNDGIMARTFAHQTVVDLARHASIPVINGLTDLLHPCQVLADLQTMRERFRDLRGKRICYIGDGNNMAHSLLFGAPKAGADLAIVTPRGFEPKEEVVVVASEDARRAGTRVLTTHSVEEGARHAHVIYTDVWASMGQEAEAAERRRKFEGYQVTRQVMTLADPAAVFMHCLPAHRGEEVEEAVADGPQSVIFDQAENRLHAQKAILATLMGKR